MFKRFISAAASSAVVVRSKQIPANVLCESTSKLQRFCSSRSLFGLRYYYSTTPSIGGEGGGGGLNAPDPLVNSRSTTTATNMMNNNSNSPPKIAAFSVKIVNVPIEADEQQLRDFLANHNIGVQGVSTDPTYKHSEILDRRHYGLLHYDSLEAATAAIKHINHLQMKFDQSQCYKLEASLADTSASTPQPTYVPLTEQERDWIEQEKFWSRPLPDENTLSAHSAFEAAQVELRAAELHNCARLLQTAVDKAVDEFALHLHIDTLATIARKDFSYLDRTRVLKFLGSEYGEKRLDSAFWSPEYLTNEVMEEVSDYENGSQKVHYLIHRLEFLKRVFGAGPSEQKQFVACFEQYCSREKAREESERIDFQRMFDEYSGASSKK